MRKLSLVIYVTMFLSGCASAVWADSASTQVPQLEEIPPATSAQTAIPKATGGTLTLEEIKPTLTVNVVESKSRVCRTTAKIKRVVVSDPSVAEAVVVSEREFVLLGKRPGNVSVQVWCEGQPAPAAM